MRLAAGSEDGALLIDNATENNLVFLGGSTGGTGQLWVNRPDGGNMVYAGDDIEGDGLLTIDNRNGTETVRPWGELVRKCFVPRIECQW